MKSGTILFVVVMLALEVAGCGRGHAQRNVCPIDGAAPQWMGRRNGNSCEYFHYNAVERQTHSWWADCKLAFSEKPKQK